MFTKLSEAFARISANDLSPDTNSKNDSRSLNLSMSIDDAKSFYASVFGEPTDESHKKSDQNQATASSPLKRQSNVAGTTSVTGTKERHLQNTTTRVRRKQARRTMYSKYELDELEERFRSNGYFGDFFSLDVGCCTVTLFRPWFIKAEINSTLTILEVVLTWIVLATGKIGYSLLRLSHCDKVYRLHRS